MILLFFNEPLAMQINYLSPAERFSPPVVIFVLRPYLFRNILSRQIYCKVFQSSSSEDLFNGSRLSRRVPSKSIGS